MVMHEKLNGKFGVIMGQGKPATDVVTWIMDVREIHSECRIVPSAIIDRHHTLLIKPEERGPGDVQADVLAHPAHPSYIEQFGEAWFPLLSVGSRVPVPRTDGLPVGIGTVTALDYLVVTSSETPVEITMKMDYIDPEARFGAEIKKVWDSGLLQKMYGPLTVPNTLVIYELLSLLVEGHPMTISGQFGESSPMTRYSVAFDGGKVDINGVADRCNWMMQQLERCAALHEKLPHGSGINDTWAFTVMYGSNAVRCANTYSPMNESGYLTDMRFHFLVDAADKPITTRSGNIVICANRHDTRDIIEEQLVEALR